ncbi:MAG: serine--tRNA ligase [Hormoscilla sp. GM7CHS1pb]|nr:serine--tRNA ligase [Hormoscilla sp. GM7CHS1pb]
MIERNLLLNDFENTAQRLARKGVEIESLQEARRLLETRKVLVGKVGDLRAKVNSISDEIGQLIRQGKNEDVEIRKIDVAQLKDNLASLESQLKDTEEKANYILLIVPNIPSDDCPDGKDETENVVLRVEGYSEENYQGKTYKPHWEIASNLGIYDAERAAKLSGSMFALLRGQGAKLLRALIQFGLELNKEKYEEILPPQFVTTESFTATGHLPKFEFDAYKLRDEDLWAIPTGEVPLTNLHRDEILAVEDLPKRYMAYTVCYRREAGSAGKDTRGMQRLHEFHKVELVRLCTPEQVQTEFEDLLEDALRPLKLLGLPYRILDLCAGDLTFSSARIFDVEVYAPGVNKWLEVSSVGIFTDFQTRRGNIRFRRGKGKTELVHALNGSAIATPRVWAAIIEHGQQPDGSVKIPEPLIPFMGCESIGGS